MALTDKKNRYIERVELLRDRLSEKYELFVVNGKKCFHSEKDNYFWPFLFVEWGAVAVEYAQGIEEARLNRFEDGDLFYLDEMDDDALFASVLQEIEQ